MQANPLILPGVKVVDLTQALAGPTCSMYLGDMGADVIKIEQPGIGDVCRGWGPPFIEGESAYFLSTNRNKRGIALNYTKPEGLAILHQLIDQADVFLINLPRQASLDKYGLSVEACLARNPRLIHASITGFGRSGPYSDRSGFDIVAQAMGGLMELTGEPGDPPMRFPMAMADFAAGLYTLISVLAALLARQHTGVGQSIDVSLVESQLNWLSYLAGNYFTTGEPPQKTGNQHPTITPYQPFKAGDGKWIVVAAGSERLWRKFCEVIGADEGLVNHPLFATNALRNVNRDQLTPILDGFLAARPAREWVDLMNAAEIPSGPLYAVDEALNDPHIRSRHMIVQMEHPTVGPFKSLAFPGFFSGTPTSYRLAPPRLGEHTDQVLAELGYDADAVARLHAEGVVAGVGKGEG
ncbi:MAG TPA: CoA transferase [Anaerolineae bacterium]|nr:CoA transferase [Anaerolineae bacterium]HNU03145.1 CoA transferase [Anaerolineae bacterium]